MDNINIKYDLALVYTDLDSGEKTEEYVIESKRKIESIRKHIPIRDILGLYKEGRDEKDREIKELLIIEKEYNGESWEEVRNNVVRIGSEDDMFNVNLLYQISLNERVEIFTDLELVDKIYNGQLTQGVEKQIARDLKNGLALYNIWVDGEEWFTNVRDVIDNLSTTIKKEGLGEFYSLELVKLFKNVTYETKLIKEFKEKEEAISFIHEAMSADDYDETLNNKNKEDLGVKERIIGLVKVDKGKDGFGGNMEEVLYEWKKGEGWVYNKEGKTLKEIFGIEE